MVLSICKYENNKITYEYEHVNLSEDDIIKIILDSKILVLIDDYFYACDFVRRKYLRFFKDEKYNLEKTTYLIWKLTSYGYVINFDNICKKLSSNIKYIKLNDYYNNEPKYLPNSITHLIFGINFNSCIDCLPFSIEYLHLGKEFNKPIDNLPGNLNKLIFNPDSKFNQSLDNLPNFLQYLFLPSGYSKTIDNLPNFLITIEINSHFEHSLNNLPNSIEKIIYYQSNNKIIKSPDTFVPSEPTYYNPDAKIGTDIKIYNIDKIFTKLPNNLKYLDLTYSYKLNLFSDFVCYQILDKNIHVKKDSIKKSQPLDNLPDDLRVLKFPSNYNLIQIHKIPQNIIKLWLSNTFNQSIYKLLNPNFGTNQPKPQTKLTHLIFGSKFNCSVNYLPDSIQYLYFGKDFNKSVENLPNSLILISFGNKFNSSINNLPSNLKNIEVGENFLQPLNNFKHGIKSIKFSYGLSIINTKFININKLPNSIEKIYLSKHMYSNSNITVKSILDEHKNLIEFY